MNFGKYSYWIGRMGVQANKILVPGNTLMLVYLTAQQQPWVILVIPIGVVALLLFMFFDHKKVIEGELSYWFMRIPEFREMRRDIADIKANQQGGVSNNKGYRYEYEPYNHKPSPERE